MDVPQRKAAVKKAREAMLLKRAALRGVASLRSMKSNFKKTESYTHLTLAQRREILRSIAQCVGQWEDSSIFADCVDKRTFSYHNVSPFEEAFDQVVSRFHRYLRRQTPQDYGLLVQDRNDTVAERLTKLMRQFHDQGTRWTSQIPLLVETPLFVDSRLTSLVQIADLCSYALRRYLEKDEAELFELVYPRGDRLEGRCVGIRHYRGAQTCGCQICANH